MVFEKVCNILSEQFGVDAGSLNMDTAFIEDLGADSLDVVELMMSIEEEFDVGEISEEEAAGMKTIGDLVRRIGDDD
ncbi:acyl carrier protein [Butyricicoccus sp.]|uniref:acyl carrier protein n=1 Tax=Butyricicoccus sp. TaxID=2049021 RepID=UPI003735AF92